MGERDVAWSDLYPGLRVRWLTPTFVKHGTIVKIKGRSMRVKFDGEARETVIPDARWWFVQGKAKDPENGLAVWNGETRGHTHLPPEAVEDDLMSTTEAVGRFGVTAKELRRWLRGGKVRGHQLQGTWLVDGQSLERHLSDR